MNDRLSPRDQPTCPPPRFEHSPQKRSGCASACSGVSRCQWHSAFERSALPAKGAVGIGSPVSEAPTNSASLSSNTGEIPCVGTYWHPTRRSNIQGLHRAQPANPRSFIGTARKVELSSTFDLCGMGSSGGSLVTSFGGIAALPVEPSSTRMTDRGSAADTDLILLRTRYTKISSYGFHRIALL